MENIKITGYLTQSKLENALTTIVGDKWRGREVFVKTPNATGRWDMSFEKDGKVVVVEFDGDKHYCDSLRIKKDREKDSSAQEQGHLVVRIPYWVQLTAQTLRHFFGLEAAIEQDFPHGFISTKIFPASFCELGVARFKEELDSLPNKVRADVIKSICDRVKEHGVEHVLPKSLFFLLSNDEVLCDCEFLGDDPECSDCEDRYYCSSCNLPHDECTLDAVACKEKRIADEQTAKKLHQERMRQPVAEIDIHDASKAGAESVAELCRSSEEAIAYVTGAVRGLKYHLTNTNKTRILSKKLKALVIQISELQ